MIFIIRGIYKIPEKLRKYQNEWNFHNSRTEHSYTMTWNFYYPHRRATYILRTLTSDKTHVPSLKITRARRSSIRSPDEVCSKSFETKGREEGETRKDGGKPAVEKFSRFFTLPERNEGRGTTRIVRTVGIPRQLQRGTTLKFKWSVSVSVNGTCKSNLIWSGAGLSPPERKRRR